MGICSPYRPTESPPRRVKLTSWTPRVCKAAPRLFEPRDLKGRSQTDQRVFAYALREALGAGPKGHPPHSWRSWTRGTSWTLRPLFSLPGHWFQGVKKYRRLLWKWRREFTLFLLLLAHFGVPRFIKRLWFASHPG